MATPNYSYEKRQKELAKKRKKEDKVKRKSEGKPEDDGDEGLLGPGNSDSNPETNQPDTAAPPSTSNSSAG